jgi:Holliday junction DNA helicase RuvA
LVKGKTARIPVRAIYRETEQLLFGFSSNDERELFDQLLKVPGVGPKTSLGIVSGMSVVELAAKINSGDALALSKLPGIGKKTAEMMIVKLGGKLNLEARDKTSNDDSPLGIAKAEAISGLGSLGFPKAAAEKAVNAAIKKLGGEPPVEQLIKEALKNSMG